MKVTPFAFSNNDGFILGTDWGMQPLIQTSTGETIALFPHTETTTLASGWYSRVGKNSGDVVHVFSVNSEDLQVSLEPPSDPAGTGNPRMYSTISEDYLFVTTLACFPGDTAVVSNHYLSWCVPPGTEVFAPVVIENLRCQFGWHYSPVFVTSADKNTAIIGSRTGPDIYTIDLQTGTVVHAELPELKHENPDFSNFNRVVELVTHPTENLIATVDVNQEIQLWTLPELKPVGTPQPTRVYAINQNTYLPRPVSPIAWSGDGARFAHISEDGSIVIRASYFGEVLAQFQPPEGLTSSYFSPMMTNLPEAIALDSDGDQLAVRLEMGVAMFAASDAKETPPEDDYELKIYGGNGTIPAGITALFHVYSNHFGVAQFYLDGEEITEMSVKKRISLENLAPGPHTIEVVLHNGLQTYYASKDITVAEE